ncbi:MAG: S9 family peptidase [Bacteroidia bacterium]|nr:MAG: S9 family peptidase [Bacteroidia bacterium]
MHTLPSLKKNVSLTGLLLVFVLSALAQERRAMTLEDVMGFHHIHYPSVTINNSGDWVAYAARPDRGDGYGKVVSTGSQTEYLVERGESPTFSPAGTRVIFTQPAPFSEREGKRGADRPHNNAVLLNVADGIQTVYENVRQARFSDSRELLFVHHAFVEDTLLSDEQNKKLEEAGTPLLIRDLDGQLERKLLFVDSWTIDSLATTLVFTMKDTLESVNGLYRFPLHDLRATPQPLDTIGKARFGRFQWFESSSHLAFMREDVLEEDTMETAALYHWRPGQDIPEIILAQHDIREGYFLPFDNNLAWTNDGQRLFFGTRPQRFAKAPKKNPTFTSVIDSLRQAAAVDVWHGNDPFIKTHEKERWSQVRRQNLMSVYHFDDNRIVWLADEVFSQLQLPRTGDHAILTSSAPYEKRITWEGWFRDVYVVNLFSGDKQLVVEEMQGMTSLSPTGRYLLYFLDKHWHVFDTSTGEHRNLTLHLEVPFYSETHDRPSTVPSYPIAGWLDDQYSVLLYDRYDIWLANLESGEFSNITGGRGRETKTSLRIRKLHDEPFFRHNEQLFIEGFSEETKERAIYTAQTDREGLNVLYNTGQNLRLRRLSKDGSKILFTNESQHIFPDLWISGTAFENPKQLSNLQEQVDQFLWGRAELIHYHSADGIPLQGIVITPGNYDPSQKYPVFVYYYEKFSQRLHDFNQTVINHRPGFGYYTSNGYVVFLPDIHFIEGRPGMSAVKSLVPATQRIIDMGIADPNAIGLHGHSWSGYQTAYVVTQTDLFTAAIAGAPVSNMTSAYGGIRWGSGLARQFQYETGQSRLGSSIFEKRYLYIENSPLFYAHEINTPMLIMHGDADEAVPWEQSIELYLAMRRAGKDVIFLQYREEPHHLQKYPNKLDYTIRMKEYFDHYLKGKEAPEWIKTGVPYKGK